MEWELNLLKLADFKAVEKSFQKSGTYSKDDLEFELEGFFTNKRKYLINNKCEPFLI